MIAKEHQDNHLCTSLFGNIRFIPEHRESFIECYHSEGRWAKFFHQATDYFGTDFFQLDTENQFLTIDKWTDPKGL
jgi:hypothetical protein